MLVIPKIEIVSGAVNFEASAQSAGGRGWEELGYSRLHVVDRDAISGLSMNASLLEWLARDAGVEVDVAAGDESHERIDASLELGVARVVVGPRGLSELDWLAAMADNFPGFLVLESNVRERRVVTRGWVRTIPIDLLDLVDDLTDIPLAALLITAQESNGEDGIELGLLEDVVEAYGGPVLVENARPSVADLRALEDRGLAGVVVPARAFTDTLDARSVAREFAP